MTVGRMLSEMSSFELAGWMAFLEIESERREKIKATEKNKKAAGEQKLLQAKLTQAGRIAAAKKKNG